MFDIQEALKNLPDSPGVYIMKDDSGKIIYIGKAISLKNRVRQYFQNSKNHSAKVCAMVSHIVEFEYILTDSELEALILECNLIKKHMPKYNVLLKDDKHYPYIKVTTNEEYPRVIITRRVVKDGSKYFGPYTDVFAVKETIQTIKKLYPIRSCIKDLKFGRVIDRPCLNYQIKRCLAPCQGNVDKDEYNSMIKEITMLLSGKQDELIEKLTKKMNDAAENLQFETAAAIRDQILSIQKIKEKQKIISSGFEDEDVFAIFKGEDGTAVEVFFIRNGKLLGRENFYFDDYEEDEKEILPQFLMQFYMERDYIPKNILLPVEIAEIEAIEEYLTVKRGNKVHLRIPKRGEKVELVELAKRNAKAAVEQRKFKNIKEKQSTEDALQELQGILDFDNPPYRIEAYDISNIQGTDPVASMVVFEGGKPNNRDYRRFKIKTIEGPNDYGSMEEVLYRRFERGIKEAKELTDNGIDVRNGKFSIMPDLVLMDGGEGQVNVAERVLSKLNIDVPVCGMVKDDKHRTRGLIYNGNEVLIYKDSNAFKLIARIQDEAHRFAINYHRSLRTKSRLSSVLDEIKGIGAKRRNALLIYFKNIDAIKNASIDELKSVEGMNEASAKAVFEYFHK